MADNSRSSREIERELAQERAQLSETIDEFFNRLTFEDVWNRIGHYMRDNRGEFGETLGRVVKEKPIAVALTAVGVTWLLFGPSARPASRRVTYPTDGRAHGVSDHYDDEVRSPLPRSDLDESRTAGPGGPQPRSDSWSTPSGTAGAAAAGGSLGSSTTSPGAATSSTVGSTGASSTSGDAASGSGPSLPRASEVSGRGGAVSSPSSPSATTPGETKPHEGAGHSTDKPDSTSEGSSDPHR